MKTIWQQENKRA